MHNWKEIPCSFDNCNFVAYNSQSSTAHKVGFHSKHRTFTNKDFPCNWDGCKSSFTSRRDLQKHVRIHTKSLLQCVFCPYRTNENGDMKCHYRFHFKMYDVKCDYCDKLFISTKYLNLHYAKVHSKDYYSCHICKAYSAPRQLLQVHIRESHKLLSRWNQALKAFDTFSRE